jgi:hypothetical protein
MGSNSEIDGLNNSGSRVRCSFYSRLERESKVTYAREPDCSAGGHNSPAARIFVSQSESRHEIKSDDALNCLRTLHPNPDARSLRLLTGDQTTRRTTEVADGSST